MHKMHTIKWTPAHCDWSGLGWAGPVAVGAVLKKQRHDSTGIIQADWAGTSVNARREPGIPELAVTGSSRPIAMDGERPEWSGTGWAGQVAIGGERSEWHGTG
ncbi:hypothetical protein J6590_025402 [Homalodisca vitripennis]|nr:hypothetical protein J6590_025402 [Homalodisca vitripennis]